MKILRVLGQKEGKPCQMKGSENSGTDVLFVYCVEAPRAPDSHPIAYVKGQGRYRSVLLCACGTKERRGWLCPS